MESFTERLDRLNSATAQALIGEFVESERQAEQSKKKCEDIKREIIEKVCPYHIGQVFRKGDGKKYILTGITVNVFTLCGGFGNKPYIDFNYTYRAICKDGHVSLNNSYCNEGELEPTGEDIDLKED